MATLPRIPPKHLKDGCYARANAFEAHYNEASRLLGEILAVCHKDGGHYRAEHGDEKATMDAINGIHEMRTANAIWEQTEYDSPKT